LAPPTRLSLPLTLLVTLLPSPVRKHGGLSSTITASLTRGDQNSHRGPQPAVEHTQVSVAHCGGRWMQMTCLYWSINRRQHKSATNAILKHTRVPISVPWSDLQALTTVTMSLVHSRIHTMTSRCVLQLIIYCLGLVSISLLAQPSDARTHSERILGSSSSSASFRGPRTYTAVACAIPLPRRTLYLVLFLSP
jgi:hypothetical protein